MKKAIAILSAALLLLLTACSGKPEKETTKQEPTVAGITAEKPDTTDNAAPEKPKMIQIRCVLADGAGTDSVLLAGYDSAELYTVGLQDVKVMLDGEPSDVSVLQDGMAVDLSCERIQELYPAIPAGDVTLNVYSRGSKNDPGGTYFDLCGLYLGVMEDMWNEDTALNENAEYVSVDLSSAPGDLSEGQKHAIAWIFAEKHGLSPLNYSLEELQTNGYIPENELYWENGVLFSISPSESKDIFHSTVLTFNIQKWRSGLGAIYWIDCKAAWPQMGTWESYKVGSFAIS